MRSLLLFLLLGVLESSAQEIPRPTAMQVEWQQDELNAFLHFSVNTFTGKEWGDGNEDPNLFNPVHFDAGKIVKALKQAGFRMIILTAKHHDGFCLWPSRFTEHSVKNSLWKNGKGDVVKEISAACRKYGLKFGFYLSPWDRHESTYGTPAYNDFFRNQLRELLTNYGDISEVWFDGARGENAKDMQYDFYGYWQLVRQLQPRAVLFSDAGPDVRWVGNESGNAGETCWSTIDTTGMAPGKADANYLNTGDPDGSLWIPAETDVSIRPGWFYHPDQDTLVKTGRQLVDLYYKSVGRNSLLLLNIPPDRNGLIAEPDLNSLTEMRTILHSTFENNFAVGRTKSTWHDGKLTTFAVLKPQESVTIDMTGVFAINRLMLQENIYNGQRCIKALVEYWDGRAWKKITEISTIGYKRLIRFPAISPSMLRFTILESKGFVELAEFGVYFARNEEVE